MLKAEFISLVGRIPLVSHAARWYAHRYPEGSVTRIRSGYAQGLQWRRHHRYVNGYWVGNYELPMQHALNRELDRGGSFLDIGANSGFFSLVATTIVGPNGKVVSVDPDPDNCEAIREQIDLNQVANWQVCQLAVSDEEGVAPFSRQKPGSAMAKLGAVEGLETFEVQLKTIDKLVEEVGAPDLIKLDIEGAEVQALRGADNLLSNVAPKWLIELHGEDCIRGVRENLADHGYQFSTLEGESISRTADLPKHVIAIK